MNHHSHWQTAVATVGAAFLALAMRSEALDCLTRNVNDEFQFCTTVFAGRVTAVDATNGLATIRITTTWKGTAQGEAAVRFNSKWGPNFRAGADYLVYCTGTNQLTAGMCSRTKPLANAEEDLVFLTGDAATAKKIQSTAVPPPAPAPQAPTPVPPGLTVSLQDNGQVVAALHSSGKTIWQVKLPTAATAVQVQDDRVIVQPLGWVLDLATGKKIEQSTAATETRSGRLSPTPPEGAGPPHIAPVATESHAGELPAKSRGRFGVVSGPVANAEAAREIAEKWIAESKPEGTYIKTEVTREVSGFWEVMLYLKGGGMHQMLIDKQTGQMVFAND